MTLPSDAAFAMQRCRLLLASLVLGVVGCGRGDPAAGAAVARDSAGVTIVENRLSDGPALAWFDDDTLMLEVGRAEGNGADVFVQIRHVIRLRTGELVVADAGAREIRVFDAEGRHRFTVGGQGEGPGEFANLWSIAQVRGDSIAAVDTRLGRVSIFSSAGGFGRSYPIPRLPGGSAPNVLGFLGTGEMVISAAATASTGRQSTVLLYTADPQGIIANRLGEYRDRELGSNGLGLAFGGAAAFGVGDSVIWYAHTSAFDIHAVDPQGVPVRIVRLDRSPPAVTEAEVAEAKASVEESLRRQGVSGPAVARILTTEYATRHALMARILLDDSGQLWISRYMNTLVAEPSVATQRDTWDVFDADGGLRGHVVLPVGFRLTQISGDRILGVHSDDLGVQRVRVYRFSRH